MRPSVKRSLTGVLIAGALAFSVVGVDAKGDLATCPATTISQPNADQHNGPDAFIGIINGGLRPYSYSYSSQPHNYSSQPDNYSSQGGVFQANTGHQFGHVRRHSQGGHGGHGYEGGYYRGY